MVKNQVYLGKAVKVFGPFPHEEFEQMYASGKLADFTWIWDWKAQAWKAIEVPPAPPPTAANADTLKSAPGSMNWKDIQALCFDQSNLVSGKLDWITESGCVLT